jgi:hypothetical protein
MDRVYIFDTTLRDGDQTPGVLFYFRTKIRNSETFRGNEGRYNRSRICCCF